MISRRHRASRGGPRQREEEGNEVAPLFLCQGQRFDLGVKLRVGGSAAVVERDHVIERRQAPVMHVRSRARHIAKRRCLEGSNILCAPGDPGPPRIFPCCITSRACGDAGVMKVLVGEIGTDVARDAPCLAAEQCQPPALRR